MKRSKIHVNQRVIYRPYDGVREDGLVVSLHARKAGLAHVLYRGDGTPKATRIDDLEPCRDNQEGTDEHHR